MDVECSREEFHHNMSNQHPNLLILFLKCNVVQCKSSERPKTRDADIQVTARSSRSGARRQKCSIYVMYKRGYPPLEDGFNPQSSSSPDSSSSSSRLGLSLNFLLSPFRLLSSFSHSLLAASRSRSGKTRSKTSLYQETGLPSMPSLIF